MMELRFELRFESLRYETVYIKTIVDGNGNSCDESKVASSRDVLILPFSAARQLLSFQITDKKSADKKNRSVKNCNEISLINIIHAGYTDRCALF